MVCLINPENLYLAVDFNTNTPVSLTNNKENAYVFPEPTEIDMQLDEIRSCLIRNTADYKNIDKMLELTDAEYKVEVIA